MDNYTSQFTCGPGEALPTETTLQMSSFPDDDWFYTAVTGGHSSRSESGVAVNALTALAHGPVWQAVNLLAGDLGQLPFHKMVRNGRNREKDRQHPVEWLINQQPNEEQSPGVWKETMLAWALLWGNGISWIQRERVAGQMRPVSLIPLRPDKTGTTDVGGKRFIYTWHGNEYFLIDPVDTFHIRGLATDGFWGRSAVDVAANVVGYGIGLRKHGNATFKNGAVPNGVLEHPGRLTLEARNNLRNEWNALHGGANRAAQIAILMEGTKFSQTTINNVDAQWLEAVKLDREQVASLFNLPAHKLNALENSAVRANVEEQNRSYMQASLSRWLVRFVEEAERKLLVERERRTGDHWFKFFTEAFLRADTKTRFEAYGSAITGRWMSPNEVREKEDMNPYDGGDEYQNPAIDVKAESQQVDAAMDVLRERVQALLEHEANRVNRAAKNVKNFIEWLTEFYDEYSCLAENYIGSACKMLDVVGVGSNRSETIQGHAEQSRAALLRATDVQPSGLVVQVENVTNKIRRSADELIKGIIGDGYFH